MSFEFSEKSIELGEKLAWDTVKEFTNGIHIPENYGELFFQNESKYEAIARSSSDAYQVFFALQSLDIQTDFISEACSYSNQIDMSSINEKIDDVRNSLINLQKELGEEFAIFTVLTPVISEFINNVENLANDYFNSKEIDLNKALEDKNFLYEFIKKHNLSQIFMSEADDLLTLYCEERFKDSIKGYVSVAIVGCITNSGLVSGLRKIIEKFLCSTIDKGTEMALDVNALHHSQSFLIGVFKSNAITAVVNIAINLGFDAFTGQLDAEHITASIVKPVESALISTGIAAIIGGTTFAGVAISCLLTYGAMRYTDKLIKDIFYYEDIPKTFETYNVDDYLRKNVENINCFFINGEKCTLNMAISALRELGYTSEEAIFELVYKVQYTLNDDSLINYCKDENGNSTLDYVAYTIFRDLWNFQATNDDIAFYLDNLKGDFYTEEEVNIMKDLICNKYIPNALERKTFASIGETYALEISEMYDNILQNA